MMNEDGYSYEGIIHRDFKKKVLLKINLILLLIFTWIILFLVTLTLEERAPPILPGRGPIESIVGLSELLIWLILYIVIVPYIVVNIILSLSLSAYVRNFTFKLSEDNIVIQHGVFTKTKETIPYIRIQSISVSTGFFDRKYKIYTVKIMTASSELPGINIFKSRREGYIPGLKHPKIIEDKINNLIKKHSQIPGSLDDKIFKPEELAFDNFISYILSKMREGKTLKTKIKELRESMKMSSAELAEKVGVPIQTVQYLEEGRYNPSLSLAYKIAVVLNCKIEDLFQLV